MFSTENSVSNLYKTNWQKTMTEFSNEQIKELQELFQEELGIDISEEEARKHATQFLNLLLVTYKEAPDSSSNSPP